jgi:hypothetical protein
MYSRVRLTGRTNRTHFDSKTFATNRLTGRMVYLKLCQVRITGRRILIILTIEFRLSRPMISVQIKQIRNFHTLRQVIAEDFLGLLSTKMSHLAAVYCAGFCEHKNVIPCGRLLRRILWGFKELFAQNKTKNMMPCVRLFLRILVAFRTQENKKYRT